MTYFVNHGGSILRQSDGAFIPQDAANMDWQDYQAWLATGNTPAAPPAPTKSDLSAYAARVRYMKETGGVTVAGQAVATDRDSQNLINGALVFLNTDAALAAIAFKGPSGFVTITRQQMVGIAQAVGLYVQACFTAEATIDADIRSDLITAHSEIDNSPHWPATTL